MEKVKFFLKRNSKNQVIVHSICRSAKSFKYLFPNEFRSPSDHSFGVQKKIETLTFQAKTHLDYTLKGKEIFFTVRSKKK
jgi:hypothetical protein